MAPSLKDTVAQLNAGRRLSFLRSLPAETIAEMLRGAWWWTSRPEQVPPPGDWLIYLVLSGRGWGKSRSGSEWVVKRTQQYPLDTSGAPTERLVVGETISDARAILLEGPSGILRVLDREEIKYHYTKSPKPRIILKETGAIIHAAGADTEDVGRGFNLADVWMDEFCKWPKARGSWIEGIMPALRANLPGDHPRAYVTTTPKPMPILREWVSRKDNTIIVVRGSTFDNSANLSPLILEALKTEYDGTNIGRQELYGELLDDMVGKLFSQTHLNLARVDKAPDLKCVVIGVDPGLTGEDDETGIVVVGSDRRGDWYVLADLSEKGVGREAALKVWRTLIEYKADKVVVETNLGKKWMIESFTSAYVELVKELDDPSILPPMANPPIVQVDAKVGKLLRAQPIGMRCEQGRLHFVGEFPKLEGQMVDYDPEDRDSPDRLDALVHACRYHLGRERKVVSISSAVSLEEKRIAEEGPPSGGSMFGFPGMLDTDMATWP